jgi:hypothetical protein
MDTPTLNPTDGPEDPFATAVDEGSGVGVTGVSDPVEVTDTGLSVARDVLTVVLATTLYPFTGIPNTVVLDVRVVEIAE